jgi:alpha-L-fucosidase
LVDIVSKGGIYLLNVGPTAEGIIPQPSVERLQAMGDWLQVNGEAIYGTIPGPIQGVDWCRSTVRPGKIYLHVFDWPADGRIKINEAMQGISRAYLLSDSSQTTLPVSRADGNIIISGPVSAPDPANTVIVLE